ncbi:ABC transporter substrate-binding protein [Anaeropeptidivorans aminofermentans]|uniref:ABC transporter substrate-binding protein n=1 Tax=Anaeropeptidivorans aminofermentans TaxID=2934315 RepID=UPI002024A0D7|nr:MqnA/MqnD/SBP family protein [Anaeropeptidivorans aminofermentans]
MNKILNIIFSVLFLLMILSGCGAKEEAVQEPPVQENPADVSQEPKKAEEQLSEEKKEDEETSEEIKEAETVIISALKGPTAMGMVKLMADAEEGTTTNKYEFTIATTDEIVPKLSKGEVDIAALPANLASVLYNNTEGKVQVMAINTLGVLYAVEKGETIKEIGDLKGKTIYSTGKGATPEFAVNYVLKANGIDPEKDLTIEYKSEAAEILPMLAGGQAEIAILPQPFVTSAQAKVEGLRTALDWTEEWNTISKGESTLVTGVIVVRKEFAEENPEAVKIFLEEYKASTEFCSTNLSDAAALVGKYGIVDAAIAEKAIPFCNITYIDGQEMKTALEGYLNVLHGENPKSVGGTLPNESFYYIP